MEFAFVAMLILVFLEVAGGSPTEDILKLVRSLNDTIHAQGNLSGLMVADLIGSVVATLFVLGHVLWAFYRFWTRAPTGE